MPAFFVNFCLIQESGVMEVDSDEDTREQVPILPEIDFYLSLMVMIYLLDRQELEKVKNQQEPVV